MTVASMVIELVDSKATCVLLKPTTKLEEVAITYFQGLTLYL